MNPSMTTVLKHAKSVAALLLSLFCSFVVQPLRADPVSPLPSFPQPFTLSGPASASSLVVTLRGRLSVPLQQQGDGEVQLGYDDTPARFALDARCATTARRLRAVDFPGGRLLLCSTVELLQDQQRQRAGGDVHRRSRGRA